MINMNDRHALIVEVVRDEQRVNIADLATRFDVSEMTIRRDLSRLEKQGFLERTQSGGVAAGRLKFLQSAVPEGAVSPRKAAIGKAAAGLVLPGQNLMLDAGITALQVAVSLPNDASLAVATISLCVVQALYDSRINVSLLGGFVRKEFPSLYGPLAELSLRNLHVDIVFLGTDGASSRDGFYTTDLNTSKQIRSMMEIADQVVVVAESSKFSRRSFARYALPGDIDVLVTDKDLPQKDIAALEESGVRVILAE